MCASPQWRWHLDEVFVRINGDTHYPWRAVDHEGEVLETFVTKNRNRKAALKFLKNAMKRYGNPQEVVTDAFKNAIFITAKRSNLTVPLRWRSGVNLPPETCQSWLLRISPP